jgi:hypothetical protein
MSFSFSSIIRVIHHRLKLDWIFPSSRSCRNPEGLNRGSLIKDAAWALERDKSVFAEKCPIRFFCNVLFYDVTQHFKVGRNEENQK